MTRWYVGQEVVKTLGGWLKSGAPTQTETSRIVEISSRGWVRLADRSRFNSGSGLQWGGTGARIWRIRPAARDEGWW